MSQAADKADRWAAFRGLSWWQLVLTLLPLALIALGGLIGGAVGGGAAWVNLKIARSAMPAAVQALVMIVVAGAAYLVWLVVVAIIASAIGVK